MSIIFNAYSLLVFSRVIEVNSVNEYKAKSMPLSFADLLKNSLSNIGTGFTLVIEGDQKLHIDFFLSKQNACNILPARSPVS